MEQVKYLILSSVLLLSVFVEILSAETCATYQEARDLAFGKDRERATSILECRRKKFPDDLDSILLLSDLYWWSNQVSQSVELAKVFLKNSDPAVLNSSRIRMKERVSRLRIQAGFTEVLSKQRNSYEVSNTLDFRYWKKNHIGFSFLRDARFFDGGTKLEDESFSFSAVSVLNEKLYLEKELSYGPNADFLPDWKFKLVPHYVLTSGEDIYIGSTYSIYESSKVLALFLGVIIPIADRLSWGMRADFTVHPSRAFSIQQNLKWQILQRLETRLIFAGGKTDEGDAQLAGFLNLVGALKWYQYSWLRIQINASIYRGDIRDENRIGGGLELLF